MSSYETPEPGKWVQPIPQGYKFQCCDCGVVHRLDFRVVNEHGEKLGDCYKLKAQFRAYRDNRATSAVRREARKRGSLLSAQADYEHWKKRKVNAKR